MKLTAFLGKGSVGLFRIIYGLLAVFTILLASYALGGHEFLAKGMWGTDMGSALSMAAWVDKYFPKVPFWYPLAGGGVSITHSYPVFPFFLVAILKRITDLNLVQAFSFLAFSSVPLMALGIYAFVATRFKNQTAALIASLFYLVSPLAWTWLFNWGFYAEAISHIFVMPAIIFWDLFFSSFIKEPLIFKSRIYLALSVLFLTLVVLSHYGSGLGLIGFYGFYIVGYAFREKKRKKVFVRGLLALLAVSILTLATTFFATFPFYHYSKVAAYAGLGSGHSFEQVKETSLSLGQVLGFKKAITEYGYPLATREISFAGVVSAFAILGVILSVRTGRSLTFGLFAIFALVLTTNANFMYWSLEHIPWPFQTPLVWRWSFVALRMVWPALGALGVFWLFDIFLSFFKGNVGNIVRAIAVSLLGLLLSGLGLYKFGYLPATVGPPMNYGARGIDLRNIWNKPKLLRFPDITKPSGFLDVEVTSDNCSAENTCRYNEDTECLKNFEAEGNATWCHSALSPYFLPLTTKGWCSWLSGNNEDHELCHPEKLTQEKVRSIWMKCEEDKSVTNPCGIRFSSLKEQLTPSSWPRFSIVSRLEISDWLRGVLDKIAKDNPQARFDFSPYSSGMAMLAPYYNLNRDFSQMYIYTVASSTLIQRFEGARISAFYIDDPFYGKDPGYINNLAKWFGINYIFFEGHTGRDMFEKGGWELWDEHFNKDGSFADGVFKYPPNNPLVELARKSTVLVVGQAAKGAYDDVFRLGSYGVLPYDSNFIVWGRGQIDSYSLTDLQGFDIVLLQGYTYKNFKLTNELLKNYVNGGGKLFIDTGWQYTVPDWQTKDKEVLDVIPLKKLSWKSFDKTTNLVLADTEFGESVDISNFGPLIYADQPWGVSTADESNLRDWAKVALSAQGYPVLAAGSFGKGKIVWSGMNIFVHAKQGPNIYYEEIKLLANLFSWLLEGVPQEKIPVSYQRESPDKIVFNLEKNVPSGSYLLWKESYYPDFHASLITNSREQTQELTVYRAGPGMTLIALPQAEAGDKIVYQYKTPWSEQVSKIISFLAFFFLLFVVLEGFLAKKGGLLVKGVQLVEEKAHFLFFGLWRKPLDWWKSDEEENGKT